MAVYSKDSIHNILEHVNTINNGKQIFNIRYCEYKAEFQLRRYPCLSGIIHPFKYEILKSFPSSMYECVDAVVFGLLVELDDWIPRNNIEFAVIVFL